MNRLVMWFDNAGLVGRQIGGAIEMVETPEGLSVDYVRDRRIAIAAGIGGPDLASRRRTAEAALCAHLLRRGQTSALNPTELALGRAYANGAH